MTVARRKIGDVVEVGGNLMEFIEFIIFKSGPTGPIPCHFGLNVFKVREIILMPEVIPYPDAPPQLLGMFSLRRENIPLLDLPRRLAGVTDRPQERNKVIVAEFNDIRIGLMVHEVANIHRVSWANITPAPAVTGGADSNLIVGVVKTPKDKTVVLLDFEKIVAEIDPRAAAQIRRLEETPHEPHVVAGRRVLCADDSQLIRANMKRVIESLGATCLLATNGLEAWRLLEEAKTEAAQRGVPIRDLVHLVITDIEMPTMDGYTLARRIKDDAALRDVPVIMHTSISAENVRRRGREVGVDEYIVKFDVDNVRNALNSVLRRFAARGSS